MIAKLRDIGERKLSTKVFAVMSMMIPVFYLVSEIICNIYDNDMYFIIATGREILANGIPHVNVWTIDSGCGMMAQQWLYAVIMAWLDSFGYAGFTLFFMAEFVILGILWMWFFSLKHISKSISFIMFIAACMPSNLYMFSLRPHIITMIFLLATCIGLEKFRDTGKSGWLVILPVMVFLEMQFHMSMWPMHFAMVLAYMVPCFYLKFFGIRTENNTLYRKWKQILITCGAMIAVMFANPYGLDGVLYTIKAFKGHAFDYVSVLEMEQVAFLSSGGAIIVFALILFILQYKTGVFHDVSVNMMFGITFLMMMYMRNLTFAIIIFAFLMRDVAVFIDAKKDAVNWRKDLKWNLVPILLAADLLFCLSFLYNFEMVFIGSGYGIISELDEIIVEIQKNYNEDMHIFTGFNTGPYVEYKGFKNVYIDARPELYTAEFTGGKDILRDYSSYAVNGCDLRLMEKASTLNKKAAVIPTNEAMQTWLDEYDFDYIITGTAEPFLLSYLMQNEDYERVDTVGGMQYVLYKKKGM